MHIPTFLRTGLVAAALAAAGAAQAFTIDFDGVALGALANTDATAVAHGVSFASGQYVPDLDADGYEILDVYGQPVPGFQHWDVLSGYDITVNDSGLGWGQAAAGDHALNAHFDQVLVRFAAPVTISSFAFTLDATSYGFPGALNVSFLDANGKTVLGNTSTDASGAAPRLLDLPLVQSGTTAFSVSFAAPVTVSQIVLPAGKYYDNLAIAAVPEPGTYALMLGGLLAVSAVARRCSPR